MLPCRRGSAISPEAGGRGAAQAAVGREVHHRVDHAERLRVDGAGRRVPRGRARFAVRHARAIRQAADRHRVIAVAEHLHPDFELLGNHGGLSAAEMMVPLIVIDGKEGVASDE